MLKTRHHTPAHLLLDDTPYFITGAIYERRPLLAETGSKAFLIDTLHEEFARFGWALHDWVVLDDHYHLLGRSGKGEDLPRLMRHIHGKSASYIHHHTACSLPVWWNFWDYCPRDEADYYTHQNYLYNNPIKHGYTTNLRHYPHSSFPASLQTRGRAALAQQFHDYPQFHDLQVIADEPKPPSPRSDKR